MIQVERGNVVLDVPDTDVQHYIDKGYSVLDNDGKIIKQAVPGDINVLKKAFVENQKEIEKLKAEIVQLKAEKQVKEKKSKASKSEEVSKPEVK